MLFKDTKKGQFGLQNLQQAGIAFVALVIILALGGTIIQEYQSTQRQWINESAGTYYETGQENVTADGLTGVLKLSQFNPIIAIAIAAVIILGIITAAFASQRQ